MLHIYIDTIPHSEQRYPTVGDYWEVREHGIYPTRTEIKVSSMDDCRYEFLVAIHEMIECFLCAERGISEESITEFDMAFEEARQAGNTDEPGNSPNAPYYEEHKFATIVEKALAAELKVDWDTYDKTVNEL